MVFYLTIILFVVDSLLLAVIVEAISFDDSQLVLLLVDLLGIYFQDLLLLLKQLPLFVVILALAFQSLLLLQLLLICLLFVALQLVLHILSEVGVLQLDPVGGPCSSGLIEK